MIKHLAFLMAFAASVTPAAAAENTGVGYGGVVVQMQPIMAPYSTNEGTRYEVLVPRIQFGIGEYERPACFMLPYIHEKFLLYLYDANLTRADFVGQRREVLANKLLEVATQTAGRGYYVSLALAEDVEPPKDIKLLSEEQARAQTKAATMSSQCS